MKALGLVMCWMMAVGATATVARGATAREIVDVSTGARWLLIKEDAHPGGPGRLVLSQTAPQEQRRIIVRAGDTLLVEEHTERVDMRLEAVALAPAAVGETLAVRLRIGGRTIKAKAIAPSKASLADPGGATW